MKILEMVNLVRNNDSTDKTLIIKSNTDKNLFATIDCSKSNSEVINGFRDFVNLEIYSVDTYKGWLLVSFN